MIYILLANEKSVLQSKIVEFVKTHIKNNNFEYSLIICKTIHIIEETIAHINNTDIVLWHPKIAHFNLELVKSFGNSIVILEKPSLYIQKISEFNYINENIAINNGFYLIYIEDKSDITNDDWKLVVQEDMYLLAIEKLLELIKKDESNTKKEKVEVEDIFSTITDSIKNQINFS
jgi:hypothetical protein